MYHIIADYYLECDDYNYTVGKLTTYRVKQKDGSVVDREGLKDVRYYTTLQQALIASCERFTKETIKSTSGDLKSLVEAYRASQTHCKEEIEKAFPNVEVVVR